jgi:4-diphosphocytidyl-2-C-methyl-D-erythritol kinase
VTAVTVRAPAKINLQLAVGPLREDGYHDLVTVFQAVSLYDEVTAAAVDGPGADVVLTTGEGAESVPAGPDNLALRAATALAQVAGLSADPSRHQEITIRKRIPVAAGLAGGSADAAAALVACNELWQAGLSLEQLAGIAAGVGSDVAFSLAGGTAVGQGRGEQLSPALVSGEYHWVLALADGQLSTPEVYRTLDKLRSAHPQAARAEAPGALDHDLMAALRAGDPAAVGRALSNDLQAAALSLYPALRKTLSAGQELGALAAIVAGSGPTCVFLAASAERAVDLAAALAGAGVCRAVVRAAGPVPGVTIVPAGRS